MSDKTTQYPDGTTFDVKVYVLLDNKLRMYGRVKATTLEKAQEYKELLERHGSHVEIIPRLPAREADPAEMARIMNYVSSGTNGGDDHDTR